MVERKDREDRASNVFFCFDVVDFCPSISENLLKRPLQLEFADQYTAIDVILHSLESMLFNEDRD